MDWLGKLGGKILMTQLRWVDTARDHKWLDHPQQTASNHYIFAEEIQLHTIKDPIILPNHNLGVFSLEINKCPVKRDHFKRKLVFQPSFFRGYVSFQGSIQAFPPKANMQWKRSHVSPTCPTSFWIEHQTTSPWRNQFHVSTFARVPPKKQKQLK